MSWRWTMNFFISEKIFVKLGIVSRIFGYGEYFRVIQFIITCHQITLPLFVYTSLTTVKWVRDFGGLGQGIHFNVLFTSRCKLHGWKCDRWNRATHLVLTLIAIGCCRHTKILNETLIKYKKIVKTKQLTNSYLIVNTSIHTDKLRFQIEEVGLCRNKICKYHWLIYYA